MTESIASLVWEGLGGFKRLSETMPESDDISLWTSLLPKLDDELARFKVWAGNSGAHKTGRASLEHRLRDASHIRQQVLRLLSDLKDSLKDATAIMTGRTTPWEQAEDEDEPLDDLETETEMEQIVQDIKELVDCLLRLSVSIQNPAPHDHFMSSASTDTSKYEKSDVRHVQDKFQDLEDCLAQRLGKAMSRRRQYFKYREAHHKKLSYGLDLHEDRNDMEPTLPAPSTRASSIPLQMKLEVLNIIPDDDTQSIGRNSMTSFATSNSGSKRLKVPPMPEDALTGPFMCPFCFLMISVENVRDWKEHVFGDLRPYNCLAPDCESSDQEFSRRNEWMQHMLQSHLRMYRCSFGCPDSFSSAKESKSHLLEAHSGAIPDSRIDSIVQSNSHPLAQDAHTNCPFCSEPLKSLKQYRRHVGNHQQDLALFALPNIECEDVHEMEESGHESDDISSIKKDKEPTMESKLRKVEEFLEEFLESTICTLEDDTSSIEKDKEPIMESKLSKVEEFLDDTICTLEEANDYEGQGHDNPKSSPAREVKKSSRTKRLNPATKRQHREDDEEPDESDDGENDSHSRVAKYSTRTGDGRKFACPFFKFDPERYKDQRTCCGPGWYEIHRLKEHLYRNHLLSTCTRCFGHFKSEKLLEKHLRTKDECVWQDESSCVMDEGAGIDSRKERQLKVRSKEEDEISRWYEIYHILFPSKIAAKDLPTPWYDAPNGKSGLSNDDDLKRKYEYFLRREIPKMIRQQLVADVEKEFQDLDETIQGRLSSWIQTSAEKCASVFQSIPTPTEAAALPNPDTRTNSRAASPAIDVGHSFLDNFDSWPFEELTDFNFNFDSEVSRFQPQDYPPTYDSAYGTGSYGPDGSSGT